MMKKTENIYDVNVYSDTELYNMLDLINPSDRELEAKILFLFNKYKNMQTPSGNDLAKFFSDIYDRFFEPPNEEPELVNEFFENQNEEGDDENDDENVFEGMENMDINGNITIPPVITTTTTAAPTPAAPTITYTKPLDFIELCVRCHNFLHNEKPFLMLYTMSKAIVF